MMLTESLRDPFDQIEVRSAPPLGLPRFQRPRRTLADRVGAALLSITGGKGTVLSHEEKAWASITFAGTRHEVVMEFCGPEAVAAGRLVADATIAKVDHRFGAMERLEVTAVLLLEEG